VSTSFADYLQLYKTSWRQLQEDAPQLLSYEDRALYTTWNISLGHVKQQSELAAKLLQLWAYFDNQDVWLELLQEGRDDGTEWFWELTRDQLVFNKAVRVLCDHALVEAEAEAVSRKDTKESRGYGMHSCVHAWTMHVVNERWDDGLARLALTSVGRHVPSTTAPQYWVTQQRLLRHANRSQSHIDGTIAMWSNDDTVLSAAHSLGDLYADQGKLDKAEEMYERALEGKEKALGPDHTSTLGTVNNLGNLYADQGKLDKAEEMYERALEGYGQSFNSDHPRCKSLRDALVTLRQRARS
jgi:tetratricopeptide (TPR) repeat protein